MDNREGRKLRPKQDFSLWPCNVCKQKDKRRICDPDKQHFPCFKE